MICLTWNEEKEHQFWEIAFLCVYGMLLSRYFVQTTHLDYKVVEYIPNIVSYRLWMTLVAGLIVMAKTARGSRYSFKELFVAGVLIVSFWRCAQVTGYTELIDLLILILGARNVSFHKIIKVFCFLTLVLLFVTVLLSVFGIIEDWVFLRDTGKGTVEKHAFGFFYPNEFGAHLFFLVLGWLFIRREKITAFEVVLMLLIAFFLQKMSYSRTNAIAIISVVILVLLAKWGRKYLADKWLVPLMCFMISIPLVCCCAMIVLSKNFSMDMPWIVEINKVLSGRLVYGRLAFENYEIKMFGQYIEMIGASLATDYANYNFLDCSYINILFRYGLAAFVSVWIVLFNLFSKIIKRRDLVFLILVVMCCLQSVMEHHLCDIAYHPFLLSTFAVFDTKMAEKGVLEICTEEPVKVG